MEQNIQGLASSEGYRELGKGSALGSFINAIDFAIAEMEGGAKQAEEQQTLAFESKQSEGDLMKIAEEQIEALLGKAAANLYNDELKYQEIRNYLVKDMGIKDPQIMFKALVKMMSMSESVIKRELTPIDRLYYIIMQQRAFKS